MKNWILTLIAIFLLQNICFAKLADEIFSGISQEQQIYYSVCSNKWFYQEPKQRNKCKIPVIRDVFESDDIEYSNFVDENGDTLFAPSGSTYEFIYNGHLITYHENDIKFFEIIFSKKNRKFIEIPVKESVIKNILGNPKIIYISDFNDKNEVTIRKNPFKRKNYLILNDTDKYFYGYDLQTANKNSILKTLFFIKKSGNVEFSHYLGDEIRYPIYKINFKFGLNF